MPGRGFVAAAFEHRASRAGDPLLHTHVVVGNVTQGPDGRWTALDGRLLYRHAKTAGFLYQAALRAQVHERLGLDWEAPASGVADLAAVPRAVIDHFSQRRAEIVEHMARRGEHSARAAQIATLDTRRAKTVRCRSGGCGRSGGRALLSTGSAVAVSNGRCAAGTGGARRPREIPSGSPVDSKDPTA